MSQEENLNPRQQSFVAAYVLSGNAEQSALKANYAKTTARAQAHRLLAQVGIAEAIKRRQTTVDVQVDYTITLWRRDLLQDIATARESGSHSAVMKGRELLGRHIGAFADTGRLDKDEAAWFAWLGASAARAGWSGSSRGQQAAALTKGASVREQLDAGAREDIDIEAREDGGGGGPG